MTRRILDSDRAIQLAARKDEEFTCQIFNDFERTAPGLRLRLVAERHIAWRRYPYLREVQNPINSLMGRTYHRVAQFAGIEEVEFAPSIS